MTNPTQALDAIEKALTDCKKLLVAIKNSNDLDGRIAFLPQKTEEAIQNAFDALAHLATLKQQVAELVAFREAVTYKISRLKRYSSHKPGREVAFFRFKANMKTGVDRCADVAIWGDVADLVEMLPPAADGGHGGD